MAAEGGEQEPTEQEFESLLRDAAEHALHAREHEQQEDGVREQARLPAGECNGPHARDPSTMGGKFGPTEATLRRTRQSGAENPTHLLTAHGRTSKTTNALFSKTRE